ncbi:serine/threonine-protein kinase [Pendulispora albinea]|uniref:Serine/threonine protein kinase n=1 Tax=Pendulispora albinea TaxID=2741071 RepID=A0ABZ2M9G6_9BACT
MLGTIIGEKYRLERSIGTGGMGEVFEARHLVTGRAVAVKLLYRQLPAREAAASDRFRHEAYAAGSLDAEHIVQVFDAGTDRDTRRRYLVMQLLHGESLHEVIKRLGPLPCDLAMRIVGQAALGLAKAHAAGVIHRDVKPANVFLSVEADEIVVKVLDFGIAKVKELDGEADPAADPDAEPIVGSPHYMSPEQAQGLPTLDHRSDLFSLGAVLYKLLSGQTSHPSADTLVRLMYAICSEPARPVNEVAPWVPAEMAAIVARAMALAPARRFHSAGEMAHAIASLVGDLRIVPGDLVPLSPEVRAARAPLAPGSGRRLNLLNTDDAVSLSLRGWGPGSGSSSDVAARLRPKKGALGTAFLGAFATALALVAITGVWRSRTRAALEGADQAAAQAQTAMEAVKAPAKVDDTTTARTVWVRVQPPTADGVTVDGRRVNVTTSGYVDVVGELGSQHEVTLRVGGRTKSTPVVVTKEGAFPDTVALSDTSSGASDPSAAGSGKSKRRTKRPAAPEALNRGALERSAADLAAAELAAPPEPTPVPMLPFVPPSAGDAPSDALPPLQHTFEKKPFED